MYVKLFAMKVQKAGNHFGDPPMDNPLPGLVTPLSKTLYIFFTRCILQNFFFFSFFWLWQRLTDQWSINNHQTAYKLFLCMKQNSRAFLSVINIPVIWGKMTYCGDSVFTELWREKRHEERKDTQGQEGQEVWFSFSCQHSAQFYPSFCTHHCAFLLLLSSQPALSLQDFLRVQALTRRFKKKHVGQIQHKVKGCK